MTCIGVFSQALPSGINLVIYSLWKPQMHYVLLIYQSQVRERLKAANERNLLLEEELLLANQEVTLGASDVNQLVYLYR